MVQEHKPGGLDQSQGMRDAQRVLTGILGYAIIATLVAVPVFTVILLVYIVAKFG